MVWISGSSRFDGDLEDERKLFYVAITRAKKLLVLVGDPAVTETMVNTNTRNRRYSALRARLIRSAKEPEQLGLDEE